MFSKSLAIALMAAAITSASVIPARQDVQESTPELVARVDQPDNPWINDNCFHPYEVPLGQKFDGCPKKNVIKDDGDGKYCSGNSPWSNNCERYCEETLEWVYGKVTPFDNTRCGKGSDCRLDTNMRVDVGQTSGFSLQIGQGAFTAGASFTWTETHSTGNGIIRDKPDNLIDSCGYWAFIPHMVTSCGKSRADWYHWHSLTIWLKV